MEIFKKIPIDFKIEEGIESVSILGQKYARYQSDTQSIQQLLRKRVKELKVTKHQYFQLLGYKGWVSRKDYDDSYILKLLKENEDPDNPGHIPGQRFHPDWYFRISQQAFKHGKSIEEYLYYFGFEKEVESKQELYRSVYNWYGNELIDALHMNAKGEYELPKSILRTNFENYIRRRKVKPNKDFLLNLISYLIQENLFDKPIPHNSAMFQIDPKLAIKNNDGPELLISDLSEDDLWHWLHDTDDSKAGYKTKFRQTKVRQYNINIIKQLKNLYMGKCQLCGTVPLDYRGITEAHHIIPFHESLNNNPSNIIILCPNHHRLLHHTHAVYDRKYNTFSLGNGQYLSVILDNHLQLK